MAWDNLQHTVIEAEAAPLVDAGGMDMPDDDHTLDIDLGTDFDSDTVRVYVAGVRIPNGEQQWCFSRPAATNDIRLHWPIAEDTIVLIDFDTV